MYIFTKISLIKPIVQSHIRAPNPLPARNAIVGCASKTSGFLSNQSLILGPIQCEPIRSRVS